MNKHGTPPCKFCGQLFKAARARSKYCSLACLHASRKGSTAPHWKGGSSVTGDGYVTRWVGHNTDALEHRLIAEKALGHALPPGAVVHHWDENKSNNTPSNLVICQDDAYHMLLHARKRRLDDTGSLDLKRCSVCKEVKPVSQFNKAVGNTFDDKASACRSCQNHDGLARYYAARAAGKQWALRHQ